MAEQVSVSNELGISKAERAEPFKTRITPLDRDDDPVELPYSPQGHQESVSANWSERGAVAVAQDELDWENSSPNELSFELQLQARAQGVSEFSPKNLWQMLETLKTWATEPTKRTGEPTRVALKQGPGSMFGVIPKVSIDVTEKTPDGFPRTAQLSMTFRAQ